MKIPIISPAKVITPAQLQLLIDAARTLGVIDELYVRMLSQAGLRSQEVEAITMSMFDPKNGVLHLPAVVMKARHDRTVPLQAPLWKAMFTASFPINLLIFAGVDWTQRLAQIAREAGVDASAQALRSSYVVYRLSQTANTEMVERETDLSRDEKRASQRSWCSQAVAATWFAV